MTSFHHLTCVSWNICEASASAAAPDKGQRIREASRLIREECLSDCTPDVIALQECPTAKWGLEAFGSLGYISMGTQTSHCGWVDLLVRKELTRDAHPIELGNTLPSVACTITLFDDTKVAFSSSHLSPFAEGASNRAKEYQQLTESVLKECANCVMLGDYNMRQNEDRAFERMTGGGWIDAWKGCGADNYQKFTWDSCTK